MAGPSTTATTNGASNPSSTSAPSASNAAGASQDTKNDALLLDDKQPWDAARISDALRVLRGLQEQVRGFSFTRVTPFQRCHTNAARHALTSRHLRRRKTLTSPQITTLRISVPGLLVPLTSPALYAPSSSSDSSQPVQQPTPPPQSNRQTPAVLADTLESTARGVVADVGRLRAGWDDPGFKRALARASERAQVPEESDWQVLTGTQRWNWDAFDLDADLAGLELDGMEGVVNTGAGEK